MEESSQEKPTPAADIIGKQHDDKEENRQSDDEKETSEGDKPEDKEESNESEQETAEASEESTDESAEDSEDATTEEASAGEDEGEDEDEDEEEEEEGGADPMDKLRAECATLPSIKPYLHHYEECVERVQKAQEDPHYESQEHKEDCVEEFFHLQHHINDCLQPRLFARLK